MKLLLLLLVIANFVSGQSIYIDTKKYKVSNKNNQWDNDTLVIRKISNDSLVYELPYWHFLFPRVSYSFDSIHHEYCQYLNDTLEKCNKLYFSVDFKSKPLSNREITLEDSLLYVTASDILSAADEELLIDNSVIYFRYVLIRKQPIILSFYQKNNLYLRECKKLDSSYVVIVDKKDTVSNEEIKNLQNRLNRKKDVSVLLPKYYSYEYLLIEAKTNNDYWIDFYDQDRLLLDKKTMQFLNKHANLKIK